MAKNQAFFRLTITITNNNCSVRVGFLPTLASPPFPSHSLSHSLPLSWHTGGGIWHGAKVAKGHKSRVVRILDPPPGPGNVTNSSGASGTVGAARLTRGSFPRPGSSGRWGSGDSGGRARVGPRPPRGNPTPVRSKAPKLSSPGC